MIVQDHRLGEVVHCDSYYDLTSVTHLKFLDCDCIGLHRLALRAWAQS